MNLSFDTPLNLLLLGLIPLVLLGWRAYIRWKTSIRSHLADGRLIMRILSNKPLWKPLPYLLGTGILCMVLALANPGADAQEIITQRPSRNILFLLDLSRSMNVQDAQGARSRLDEAKGMLSGLLPTLANDRIGIVVFAGEARSILPLTSDYSAVDTYLTALDTDAMKIQGTDLLAAFQQATRSFSRTDKSNRLVVLLSDGEDNEEHFEKALNLAREEGIQVISVPVGSAEGGPIPEYFLGQMMGYKTDGLGQTVISKVADEQLRELAKETGGEVIEPAAPEVRSQALLKAVRAQAGGGQQKVKTSEQESWFQWPLGIAVLLLTLLYLFNPKKELNV